MTDLNKICDKIQRETQCRDGLCIAFWVSIMIASVYLLSVF